MDCNLHETIVSTVDIVPASWNAIMTYEELIKVALVLMVKMDFSEYNN